MAVSYLTSETLIDSVVRRAHIPISEVTFTDDDILAFANEEMMMGMLPAIMKMHEEFYVYPFLIPLVSAESYYEIPDRAIGSKVRAVFYIDASSNLQEMARVNPEDIAFYQNRSSINFPRAFYLENNYLVMVPIINDNPQGNLVAKVYIRPNQLVDSSRVATVTSVNTTTGIVTVDSIPSMFSLSSTYDFIQVDRTHRLKGIDVPPITINSTTNTITFAPSIPLPTNPTSVPPVLNTALPLDLNVGDLICLAGETDIIQMPDELHSILSQRVVCRCLEAQKDLDGLQAANAKLQEMEMNLGMIIDNRTEGQPKKVNNLRGALRSGKFRRRRSTY